MINRPSNRSATYSRFRWKGMTLWLLLILAILPVAAAACQPGGPGSQLDRYLAEAAQNNPELKAAFSRYLASVEQVPQMNTLPDPELAFGYFINPIETRVGPQEARVGLTQMFPWFGTLKARGNAASQMAKARFEEFQEQRNRLFFEIKKNWYRLYETDEDIRILRENIDILNTFESLATRRYEGAQVSQVDVLRVQIEKEDAKIRLENLNDDLRVKRHAFNSLLNRSSEETVLTPDSLTPFPVSAFTLPELRGALASQN
ncbi:MAG: TolC family protein, partial [Balneolaceae bacterium]|nr:TolC family protein [Balneolaceae bacterium]